MFAALYFYFYLYARSSKQTIGQYVCSYTICAAADTGKTPQYALRILYSYIGFCTFPVTIILRVVAPDEACWWDAFSHTKAVQLEKKENE